MAAFSTKTGWKAQNQSGFHLGFGKRFQFSKRRLKLSYSSAAQIVDQMEELGIIGPYEGDKPRAVLIDREEWEKFKGQLEISS